MTEGRSPYHIIQLVSDLGANPEKKGAALGPAALLEFDATRTKYFYNVPVKTIEVPQTFNRPQVKPEFAHFVDIIGEYLLNSKQEISDLLSRGYFPFVMSGDHSNAASVIAALRSYYPNKKIGVVWIDAHADVHTPYTTPSGNMHGMPVAMSLGIDNLSQQKNSPNEEVTHWWSRLKNLSGVGTSIESKDICFVAVRDKEEEETAYIKQEEIKTFTPEVINEHGITKIYNGIIEYFKSYDYIYVSFDIDSLDKSLVPGTGTPVDKGLSKLQAGELLYLLWNNPKLIGFEIAEINPGLDSEGITLPNVYDVLQQMLGEKL